MTTTAPSDCFAAAGIKIPRRRGRPAEGRCACGERVRFDIATVRVSHFLVCPTVAATVTDEMAPVELDHAALAAGLQLAPRLPWLNQ